MILKDIQATNEEEIIEFAKQRLAGFKTPKKIFIMDALPKKSFKEKY